MEDILFDLYYKQSHRNEELEQTIEELQNDLKQAQNEIKLLNNQIDKLIAENEQLKFRNKMLIKIGLNSIYGIHCCKNHCVYTDTDSIKTDVLDKIRAEIEEQIKRDYAFAKTEDVKIPVHCGTANGLQVAIKIIDKYKESEG